VRPSLLFEDCVFDYMYVMVYVQVNRSVSTLVLAFNPLGQGESKVMNGGSAGKAFGEGLATNATLSTRIRHGVTHMGISCRSVGPSVSLFILLVLLSILPVVSIYLFAPTKCLSRKIHTNAK
jgi:hypothetical protein